MEKVLERFLPTIQGSEPVFDVGKCGLRVQLRIDYDITDVDVELKSPFIIFHDLEIDTTWKFRITIDFNDLYECLRHVLPLPPRCVKVCVPFTDWCYEKCLNLGSVGFTLPVPLSFDLTANYKLGVEIKQNSDGEDEFHVFPEIATIPIILIDAGRINERICQAVAGALPWPLSIIAGKLCSVFGQVFDVIEDAVSDIARQLQELLFHNSNGWLTIKLKFVPILKLPVDRFPGVGKKNDPKDPFLPVHLVDLSVEVNSADELDIHVRVLPA